MIIVWRITGGLSELFFDILCMTIRHNDHHHHVACRMDVAISANDIRACSKDALDDRQLPDQCLSGATLDTTVRYQV